MTEALVQVGSAFVATGAFAVLFNLRARDAFLAALGGALAWGANLGSLSAALSPASAYLAASIAVGLYAETMAVIMKKPVTVFIVCAIIPLVPGGGMYYTMLHAVHGNEALALSTAFDTLSLAGAIASGLAITGSISRAASLIRRPRRGGT